jgi:hypothetical protein
MQLYACGNPARCPFAIGHLVCPRKGCGVALHSKAADFDDELEEAFGSLKACRLGVCGDKRGHDRCPCCGLLVHPRPRPRKTLPSLISPPPPPPPAPPEVVPSVSPSPAPSDPPSLALVPVSGVIQRTRTPRRNRKLEQFADSLLARLRAVPDGQVVLGNMNAREAMLVLQVLWESGEARLRARVDWPGASVTLTFIFARE